ncbi:hypothetical protein PV350_04830 [Streptomyces sp. PA03-6a]|nr:hypothetical protein [Streptomyces sp. PA03-6a]
MADVDWWRLPPPPPIEQPAPLTPPEPVYPYATFPPDPEPEADSDPWWHRLRPVYNGTALVAALPMGEWWAGALTDCAHDQGPAGAWVLAAVMLATTAAGAHGYRHHTVRRWITRVLLFAAVLGPVLALPVVRATVYLITGVAP